MGPQSSWDPLSATDVLLTCKVPQGPAWQGPWVEILGCSLSEPPPTTTRFYSLSKEAATLHLNNTLVVGVYSWSKL